MNVKWIDNMEYSNLLIKNVFGVVVVIPTQNEEDYFKKMKNIMKKVSSNFSDERFFDLNFEGKSDEYFLPIYFMKERDYLDHTENNFAGLVRVTAIGPFEADDFPFPLVSKRLKEGIKGAQLFDESGRELIRGFINNVAHLKHDYTNNPQMTQI